MSSAARQPYNNRTSLRHLSLERGLKKAGTELEKISGEIAWYEQQARNSARLTLQYKLEIGKRLARAKELLPHGHFLYWARQQFGWTARHVQNHLLLAANAKRVSHLPVGASLRLALASIQKTVSEPVSAPANQIEAIQRVYLVGDILEGNLDRERLLAEIEQIAAELGTAKIRWKVRWVTSSDA
jgi:hypothetical protein